MNKIKITLRNGKSVVKDVPNIERLKDYVEAVNDKRARFFVFDDYAVNLDLIEEIEPHEETASPVLDLDAELGDGSW